LPDLEAPDITPTKLADALAEVYASVVPSGGHPLFRGYAANRSTDAKTGMTSVFDAVAEVPNFGAPTKKWFPWTRAYLRDQWLDLLLSYSDHAALGPMVRDRLFEAIGAAIDDYGGSSVVSFETVLITATRLGYAPRHGHSYPARPGARNAPVRRAQRSSGPSPRIRSGWVGAALAAGPATPNLGVP
jgi:hypothetical protein